MLATLQKLKISATVVPPVHESYWQGEINTEGHEKIWGAGKYGVRGEAVRSPGRIEGQWA